MKPLAIFECVDDLPSETQHAALVLGSDSKLSPRSIRAAVRRLNLSMQTLAPLAALDDVFRAQADLAAAVAPGDKRAARRLALVRLIAVSQYDSKS